MNRRDILRLAGGMVVLLPHQVRGQRKRMRLIGILMTTSPWDNPAVMAALWQGLNEAGYVEGQNVTAEYRYAEGYCERLPGFARELAERKVDVLISMAGQSGWKHRPI